VNKKKWVVKIDICLRLNSPFFVNPCPEELVVYQPKRKGNTLMRKLFEEYGTVVIGLVIAVIFMVILGPVGDSLAKSIKEFVSGFAAPLK